MLDCIEQYADTLPLGGDENQYLLGCYAIGQYVYLDTDERRNLARHPPKNTITKHNNTHAFLVNKNCKLKITEGLITSATYIHVTDEHGNEVPRTILKNIVVKIDGINRMSLTPIESKYNQSLPHKTRPNESHNLYYISYWSGRTNSQGAEQGLNSGRLNYYAIELQFEDWVPNSKFKVVISHRSQNTLQIKSGMVELAPHSSVSRVDSSFDDLDPDQIIDILADVLCPIMYAPFEENVVVDKCNQCKNIFTSSALLSAFNISKSFLCPVCRQPHNTSTFVRGKAHILQTI